MFLTGMKWFGIVILGLLVLGVSYLKLTEEGRNAEVAREIRDNPDGVRAKRAMLLHLADGTSYPVNYLKENNLVFVGVDGFWWRAFEEAENAPVAMLIRGRQYKGLARVVLNDPAYTQAVFARLRPTAPEWLPAWLNGKLVVITLTEW